MLPFRTIVFPTDFSAPAEAALGAAVEVARHFQAALHLVHVVPALPATTSDPNFTFSVPEYEALLHVEARDRLERLAAGLRDAGLSCDWSIGNGNAGREIVRIAAERGADLIVIATHGETGWRHAIFGSVAERVVQHASCPVLTIRSSDRE
jgi:nucleotide-binding universal stress UspA family protein